MITFSENQQKIVDALETVNKKEINEVLEQIRDEIEKVMNSERIFDTENARAQYIALGWCKELIDKYMK